MLGNPRFSVNNTVTDVIVQFILKNGSHYLKGPASIVPQNLSTISEIG